MIVEAGKLRLECGKTDKYITEYSFPANKFLEWVKIEYPVLDRTGFCGGNFKEGILLKAIFEWNSTAELGLQLSVKDIDDIERTIL